MVDLVQEQEKIYNHEILWRSGLKLLEHAKKLEEGAYYFRLSSLLMFYLAYEGFVNYLLGQLFPPKKRKEEKVEFSGKGLEGKIQKIIDDKNLDFEWKKGEQPYQLIKELDCFRSRVVHSRTETNDSIKLINETDEKKWDLELDKFFRDTQTVEKYRDAIKNFCQSLQDSITKKCSYVSLQQVVFEGPLASSSGRHRAEKI